MLRALPEDERGQALGEYAFIIALVVAVSAAVVGALGLALISALDEVIAIF